MWKSQLKEVNMRCKVIDRSGNRSNYRADRTITARGTEERAFLPLSVVGQTVLRLIVRSVALSNRTNDYFPVYFLNEWKYSELQTRSRGVFNV